jgi:hypothetical protein
MALRGRMLSPSGILLAGDPGIIRLPDQRGFAAAMWKLDEATARSACIRYHAEKAPCEVIAPEVFAKIAALLPDPAPPPGAAADPEGDDPGKTKAPGGRKTRPKNGSQ